MHSTCIKTEISIEIICLFGESKLDCIKQVSICQTSKSYRTDLSLVYCFYDLKQGWATQVECGAAKWRPWARLGPQYISRFSLFILLKKWFIDKFI